MNTKLIIGIIIFVVGIFYAAVPHDIHVSSAVGFGLEHTTHVLLGLILLVIGIILIWKR